jgi:hypothetical protein
VGGEPCRPSSLSAAGLGAVCCDVAKLRSCEVAKLRCCGSLPPLLEQSPLNVPPSGVGTLTTLTASCTRVWPRSRADEAIVYARGSSGGSSGRARVRAAARRVDYEREHGASSHIPNAPTQSVRATASAMPQVRARTCMCTCMHTSTPIHHKLRVGARSGCASRRHATHRASEDCSAQRSEGGRTEPPPHRIYRHCAALLQEVSEGELRTHIDKHRRAHARTRTRTHAPTGALGRTISAHQ